MNARACAFLLVLAVAFAPGCAAIVSDNESTTYIETDPENARCELHGQDFKRVVNTPNSITLPAKAAPITIACKADGYRRTVQPLDTSADGWIFGNILLGGIVGIVIDAASQSGFKYPPHVTVILEPEQFASKEVRDEWFAERRKMIKERWDKASTKLRNDCRGPDGSQPGFDCNAAYKDLQEKGDKELRELDERWMRAKVRGGSGT